MLDTVGIAAFGLAVLAVLFLLARKLVEWWNE